MEAHAGGMAQNVSLTGRDLSLKKVFAEIKHQTGYAFFYNYALLKEAHNVTLDVKNVPLTEVLDKCFADQPLGYVIENKTVVVTVKPTSASAASAVAETTAVAASDNVTVKGKVVNEKGEPIVGASVRLRGEKVGTTTDADGVFSIKVPLHSVLLISSIGYQLKEITVNKEETISVQLSLANKSLDEVVVTGFGESRAKRGLGYSVTQITGDQIREANAVDPIVALQGMVPGMQVQPGVGGPSATPRFQIRGASSLDPYGNTPLIVVDGVILDDQSVLPNQSGQYGSTTDFGNILKDINPDDIESLSVLKGGAVTALYGSRANNGVILIKTKKGYNQKGIGVNVSHSDYVDDPYKTIAYQNSFGAGTDVNDMDTTSTGQLQIDPATYVYEISFGPAMTGQKVLDPNGNIMSNVGANPLSLFRKGVTDNTNISLSSASDKTTFRLSYSNLAATGIAVTNQLKRNSIQLHVTDKLASHVLVDVTSAYVQSGTYNPALQGGNSPLYALAYDMPRNYNLPYWKSHFIDPNYGGSNSADALGFANNILFPYYENNDYLIENNFRGNVQLTANITPWLDLLTNTSANIYNRNEDEDTRGTASGFANPGYYTSNNLLDQFRYNASLYYHKSFHKDWTVALQGGGEIFTSENKGDNATTSGGNLPDVYRLSNSTNAITVKQNTPNSSSLSSLFYQGSLEYKSIYYLNFYGRNDWNSTLVYSDGHGTYSYFYPGADVAWIFSDGIKGMPKWLNYGKLRFSYAQSGNGTTPYNANTGAYGSNPLYTSLSGGTVVNYGYTSQTLPNYNLIPEKSNKFEAGVEFKMLHTRLGGDVTVYTQNTANQIINFTTPNYSGVTSKLLNGGVVRNRGLELTIFGTPIQTRNFSWVSQFNYTLNRNKVLTLPLGTNYLDLEDEDGIRTVAVKGGDYALLVARYGYARYQATDANGDNVSSPLNGQHVINFVDGAGGTFAQYERAQTYGTNASTQEPVIGSTLPKFLGSWRNTFNYKKFSLSIFLDSKFGGLEYSTTYFYGSQEGNLVNTLPGRTKALGGLAYTPVANTASYLFNFATPAQRQDGIALSGVFAQGTTSTGTDGAQHDVSNMTFADAMKKGYVTPVDAADYYINTFSWGNGIREAGVFKSSWVAVRDISLGYDLPNTWASKVKMNNLRAIISVRNPFYLYNSAPDNINPDNLNDSGSGAAFERGGIPYIRSYGFSINAGF